MSSGESPRRSATERKLRGTSCRSHEGTCEELLRLRSEQCFGLDGPTMASLPYGVLSHIFDELGPRDLASASCVCRAWRRLVALEGAANQVWRSFYSARWQLSSACWPVRNPLTTNHTNNNNTGTGITTISATISGSKPISVPGSSKSSSSSSGSVGAIVHIGSDACAACSDSSSSSSRSSGASPSSSSTPSSSSAVTTPSSSPEMRWQWAYGTKMLRLRSWSGRYSADQVMGHKLAVRAVRLLPACDLMATASLDRTVRLWDLRSGLPLGHSRPHGGTVRCLALDTGLLASGSSDSLVRVWRPGFRGDGVSGSGGLAEAEAPPLFSISSKPYILRGHGGPVSCLALDESLAAPEVYGRDAYGGTLFSGSWDCTVRVWRQATESSDGDGSGGAADGDISDCSGGGATTAAGSSGDERSSGDAGGSDAAASAASRPRRAGSRDTEDGGWSCAGVLQYSDWVYCCAVRGGNLLVAAGSEVVVTDATTGRAVRRFADVHDGAAVACLEGCRSGQLLFTGSGDGLLLAHDLRLKQGSRVLWHHNAAVTGLAFEDPWLASSSADGCVILQDSEQALSAGGGSPQRAFSSSCRALHCPPGQPALCLDLADQWLAAGTESGVVRLWDFTGAAAAAERAAAARAARSASKAAKAAARQQHHQQHQQQHHERGSGARHQHQQQQRPQQYHGQQPLLVLHHRHHHQQHYHHQQAVTVDLQQPPKPQQQTQTKCETAEALHRDSTSSGGGGSGDGGGGLLRESLRATAAAAALVEGSTASGDAEPVAVTTAGPEQAGRGRRGSGGGGVGGANDAPSSSARRGGGRAAAAAAGGGGGGYNDRWHHGGGGSSYGCHAYNGVVFSTSKARAPKPPPPPPLVAPTFRYVGSGAGGGSGTSGFGGGRGGYGAASGMAAISGHFGNHRMHLQQRPPLQQQQQR